MEMKKEEFSIVDVDRVSQLPDEIMYLILQRVPSYKEAARTSVLSERWLQLWRSYPILGHDRVDYMTFRRFADATSKRLLHWRSVPLLLDSFNISFPHLTNVWWLPELLSSASLLPPIYNDDDHSSGIRSPLKVVIKTYYSRAFLVKAALLNCGRTKILHLEGLNLSEFPGHTTCWYNLQELTLRSVQVIKGCFTSYLANAPLLEKLSLTNISGLDSLDVSASDFPSLKFLSYDQSAYNLNQLNLSSAPFLQTLNFWGNGNVPNLVSAPNLKFVRLEFGGELWRAQYEDMISKLPSLETLHLNVTPDARFRISSRVLRKLTLGCFKRETELLIDAPNLITLSITAFVLPININIVNVASSCQSQCVVECYLLYDEEITKSWFTDLRKCLATLTARFHHLVFTLVFIEKFCLKLTEMELSEIGCGSSPIVVQHLQLGTDLPLESGVNRLRQALRCLH